MPAIINIPAVRALCAEKGLDPNVLQLSPNGDVDELTALMAALDIDVDEDGEGSDDFATRLDAILCAHFTGRLGSSQTETQAREKRKLRKLQRKARRKNRK